LHTFSKSPGSHGASARVLGTAVGLAAWKAINSHLFCHFAFAREFWPAAGPLSHTAVFLSGVSALVSELCSPPAALSLSFASRLLLLSSSYMPCPSSPVAQAAACCWGPGATAATCTAACRSAPPRVQRSVRACSALTSSTACAATTLPAGMVWCCHHQGVDRRVQRVDGGQNASAAAVLQMSTHLHDRLRRSC